MPFAILRSGSGKLVSYNNKLLHGEVPGGATLDDFVWFLRLQSENASRNLVTAEGNAIVGNGTLVLDGTAGTEVTVPDSPDWDITSQSMTIELKFTPTDLVSTPLNTFASMYQDADNRWRFDYNTGSQLIEFSIRKGGSWVVDESRSFTMVEGVEYYLALVKNGTTWSFWIDGSQVGASFVSSETAQFSSLFRIGGVGDGSSYAIGKISGYRFSQGAARDVSIIPSTFASDSSSVLVLNFAGFDGLRDLSGNQIVVPYNDANTTTEVAAVGSYSLDCQSNGYVDLVGDTSDFNFNGTPVTIEGYVRFPSVVSRGLWGFWTSTSNRVYFDYTGSGWRVNGRVNNSQMLNEVWSHTPLPDTWYHISLNNNGGSSWTLYIDGVSQGTRSDNSFPNLNTSFKIGQIQGQSISYWNGFVDLFEISKGVMRRTGNFTPPVVPFNDQYTVFASSFEGLGATATRIIDTARPSSLAGFVPDVSGNQYDVAQATEAFQFVYSSADESLTADGSNDYMETASTSDADITGAFTMFVQLQLARTTGNNMYVIHKGENEVANQNQYMVAIRCDTDNWEARVGNGTTNYTVSGGTLDTDRHVLTFQYEPSTHLKLWLDGVLIGTNTTSIPASITARAEKLTIGAHSGASGGKTNYYDGKLWGLPLMYSGTLSDADRSEIEALLT